MFYPCNYGFIPKTLHADGDPTDVLVLIDIPLNPGVVIPCRPIGVLKMEDDGGLDDKIIKQIQEEDDSDDDAGLDQLSNIYADEEEEFKESECQCPMCNCMNTIYTRWEGFTPESSIERAMYNHINDIA